MEKVVILEFEKTTGNDREKIFYNDRMERISQPVS